MTSSIYLIKSGLYCKIGKANDVRARIRGLQTSSPRPITLLWSTEFDSEQAALAMEAELHQEFATRRTGGEWFWYHPEIEERVSGLGDESKTLPPARMADWFESFIGKPIPDECHRDELIQSFHWLTEPVMVSGGQEFGYASDYSTGKTVGFYKHVPGAYLAEVGLDGSFRMWGRDRLQRYVDLQHCEAAHMYREANEALAGLIRRGVTGVTTAERIYDVAFTPRSSRPVPDAFPDEGLFKDALDAWEYKSRVIPDLEAMAHIIPLDGPCIISGESRALVWPVPAPAVQMWNRALPKGNTP